MVKGISKQVIVVHPTGKDFFEQAIFILKPEHVGTGISDEQLIQQAKCAIRNLNPDAAHKYVKWKSLLYALIGGAVSCGIWTIFLLL